MEGHVAHGGGAKQPVQHDHAAASHRRHARRKLYLFQLVATLGQRAPSVTQIGAIEQTIVAGQHVALNVPFVEQLVGPELPAAERRQMVFGRPVELCSVGLFVQTFELLSPGTPSPLARTEFHAWPAAKSIAALNQRRFMVLHSRYSLPACSCNHFTSCRIDSSSCLLATTSRRRFARRSDRTRRA